MKLITNLLILLTLINSAAAITLTVYPEGEQATGYKFIQNIFTSNEDADIYAKELEVGESSTLVFFANKPNFVNKGREQMNEFKCSNLEIDDYTSEVEIYERQSYCILTYDRSEVIKVYVESVAEDKTSLELDWEVYEEINEPNEEVPLVETEVDDFKYDEPGEAGIADKRKKKELEDKQEADEDLRDEGKSNPIANKVEDEFRKNPVLSSVAVIIIIIVIISLALLLKKPKK